MLFLVRGVRTGDRLQATGDIRRKSGAKMELGRIDSLTPDDAMH